MGRMPAEGQALVEWMRANENKWRVHALDAEQSLFDL
jgi:hypothetical protein